MRSDVDFLKQAGFNMIRKHIKVEPLRYYHYCDRVGILLWQDQVSGGLSPKWTYLSPETTDAIWPDADHSQWMTELKTMMDTLHNVPSIVVWTPFNEAWGQHRTMEVGKWTVAYDPSRLVNIASGGNFWPVGHIADQHSYPQPNFPLKDQRFNDYIKVVGEFGGHGFPVEGHLWNPGIAKEQRRVFDPLREFTCQARRTENRRRSRRSLYADHRCRRRGQRLHHLRS
jgi:beta-galactosidase